MEEIEPPKDVLIDIDKAIERALDKRESGIKSVIVLCDSVGNRAEIQSSDEKVDSLLSKAHSSLSKLKVTNGKPAAPGYAG